MRFPFVPVVIVLLAAATPSGAEEEEDISVYEKHLKAVHEFVGVHDARMQNKTREAIAPLVAACSTSSPGLEAPFSMPCAILLKAGSLARLVFPFDDILLKETVEVVASAAEPKLKRLGLAKEKHNTKIFDWIRELDASLRPRHTFFVGVLVHETAADMVDLAQALSALNSIVYDKDARSYRNMLSGPEWRMMSQRRLLCMRNIIGDDEATAELNDCKKSKFHLNDCPWTKVAQMPMMYDDSLLGQPLWDWRDAASTKGKLAWVAKVELAFKMLRAELDFVLERNRDPLTNVEGSAGLQWRPKMGMHVEHAEPRAINVTSSRGRHADNFAEVPIWETGNWYSRAGCEEFWQAFCSLSMEMPVSREVITKPKRAKPKAVDDDDDDDDDVYDDDDDGDDDDDQVEESSEEVTSGGVVPGTVSIVRVLPGTRVSAHHGPTNERLTVHMCLRGCSAAAAGGGAPPQLLFADGTEVPSREGKAFVWDDTFEHEIIYEPGTPDAEPFYYLSVHIWHPDLLSESDLGKVMDVNSATLSKEFLSLPLPHEREFSYSKKVGSQKPKKDEL